MCCFVFSTDDVTDKHTSLISHSIYCKCCFRCYPPGNKTVQYYAMAALRILRKLHLTKEWQLLEKCTALIIQWCRPNANASWDKFAKKTGYNC